LQQQLGEQNFSLTILQPMLFYNIGENGWTVHYNNIISHDWNAATGNEWTVHLCLGVNNEEGDYAMAEVQDHNYPASSAVTVIKDHKVNKYTWSR
jgi:hypothetical protein